MWYKQEGEAVPFTCWPFMAAINQLGKPAFRCGFNTWKMYGKKMQFEFYLDIGGMEEVADFVFKTYATPAKMEAVYTIFETHAKHLQKLYLTVFNDDITTYSDKKLITFYHKLWKEYEKFWAYSLFIDGFDAGYDQREIAKLAGAHQLAPEEISVLTTPEELGFGNERLLNFLEKLSTIFKKEKDILQIITSKELSGHIKEFDWCQSTYGRRKPIHPDQLREEIEQYKNDKKRQEECTKLKTYPQMQKQKIHHILKKRGLKENPLYFFQKITFWREQRKKHNLMGLYLLHRILEAVEKNRGIPKEHLNFLNYDEFEPLMAGTFDQKILKKRREEGVMITVEGTTYTETTGKEAEKERDAINAEILKSESKKELKGFVACVGKATGKVRLIITRNDFETFKEGEILVTGMTRPEHVPLMKKAKAIVTNEGGITCHAAIVSRELNVPCIIGTKVATRVLKTGDTVEVDAQNGTVRICE